ncbi:VOC family protein [Myxococcota bacterium]|nr:VOC family protein [Myxococcota bacterium]
MEGIAARLGLDPIDQISYVVEDMDRALLTFEAIYGPFTVIDTELEDTLYRGRKTSVKLRLGFGRSGPVEIELVQVLSGESPHAEHLDGGGDRAHHVRFRVENLEKALEAFTGEGFEAIWYKRFEGGGPAFAYLEAPPHPGGPIIELLEM